MGQDPVVNSISIGDSPGALNGLQKKRCVKHVFFCHDLFEDKNTADKAKPLLETEKRERYADEKEWWPDIKSIASHFFDRLTFLKKEEKHDALLSEALSWAIRSH